MDLPIAIHVESSHDFEYSTDDRELSMKAFLEDHIELRYLVAKYYPDTPE